MRQRELRAAMNSNKKATPGTQNTGRITGGYFIGGRIISVLIRPDGGGGIIERPHTAPQTKAKTAAAGRS